MYDYEPVIEETWTKQEIVWLGLAILFILVEISTMWTWCQWFTNCPKS